jgi:D-serine dehydratase
MTDELVLDHRCKSFPLTAPPCKASEIAERGWNLLADDLAYPLAVIRRSALAHNIAWMQDFVRRKGLALAPHGKTTMSPELFAAQLRGGAWGLTFATVFQLAVGLEAGARRAIIANQVLADVDLDGLDRLLSTHSDARVWFLVDSTAQLALIEDWAQRRESTRRFDVLVEIGIPGQRTGCRTFEQALALAQAVAGSAHARLGGIECYEGGLATCDSAHDTRAVGELIERVLAVVRRCDALDLFADDSLILSAGGSSVFDLVVPLLRADGENSLKRSVQGVLRSGCYVTHDQGQYTRYLKQVEQREGLDASLRPALEVWSLVQSVPEPGLALLSCGRRDISHDIELPMPVRHAPRGARSAVDAPPGWKISALNDQHAYLRFEPAGTVPKVGDRVALGLSHPCTTFDKWRWMALVEDDGAVTGAISTRF